MGQQVGPFEPTTNDAALITLEHTRDSLGASTDDGPP
jgi:hypothetical protein